MFEEIKNIKTSKKDIRNFGITIGIILLIVAGFLYHKEKDSFQLFIFIAGSLISLGFLIPFILKPIYLVWMIFAVILGWFMTRLILSLLFSLVITPIGLVLKIMGKDLLELKKDVVQGSYWNVRDRDKEQNQNYEKQF
tara:strand:+ start:122 stop:535 length:414 start_codon:yes stop_codon:yes gene_type:complete